MTAAQLLSLTDTLLEVGTSELHHGDCVGADAEADLLCQRLDIPRVVHPPLAAQLRHFTLPGPRCTVLVPRPYLERNRAIVDAGDIVIAAPQTLEEQQRSGTWATVRYARRLGRMVILLAPSSAPQYERPNMDVVSLDNQISCVRRELSLRRAVYPRLIQNKKMTQAWADFQMDAMEAVLKTLEQLHHTQEQAELFADAGKDSYAAEHESP